MPSSEMPFADSSPTEPTVDQHTKYWEIEPQPDDAIAARDAWENFAVPDVCTVAGWGRERNSPGTVVNAQDPVPTNFPVITGYVILEEIARGGMGRVYAGRDLTLEREVAIKTLLPGAHSHRFIVEAKITAQLPHPAVPPVYALGALADGMPYLVMKRIHGQNLATLLGDRPNPEEGLPGWLLVFEQIAQAVGFAHSQGVLHRDLKPANIMVGAFGEVQVMDWGLAKWTIEDELADEKNHDLDRKTTARRADVELAGSGDSGRPALTKAGTVMGTPGYMSPEQARGEVVDARADVFALGSILSVILTNKPAFEGASMEETLTKAANADLGDAFVRLDGCNADRALVELAKSCLAREIENRPADARAVAERIAAYRAGVENRLRQSERERAVAEVRVAEQAKRRVVWRGLVVVLITGLVLSSALAGWAYVERNEAHQWAESEKQAKLREQSAKIKAETAVVAEAKAREEAVDHLNNLLHVVADIDYDEIRAAHKPLEAEFAQRLIEAGNKMDAARTSDPRSVAVLQNRIGATLLSLDHARAAMPLFDSARTVFTEKLGANHLNTLDASMNLANAKKLAGDNVQAITMLEDIVQRMRAELGPHHTSTVKCVINLGAAYQLQGHYDKATDLLQTIMKSCAETLGADHSLTLGIATNLANVYSATGKPRLAVELLETILPQYRAVFGLDHPRSLDNLHGLASAYQDLNNLDKAGSLYEEVLQRQKKKRGVQHRATLATMNNLSLVYLTAGRIPEALKLCEENAGVCKNHLGEAHPQTLVAKGNLASAYRLAGQQNRAIPLLEDTLGHTRAKMGADHPHTLSTMNNLAVAYWATKQLDKSIPMFEETLRLRRAKLGSNHPDTISTLANLGVNLRDAGRLSEALPILAEAYRGAQKHPKYLWVRQPLLDGYVSAGATQPALALVHDFLKEIRANYSPDSRQRADQLAIMGMILLKISAPTEAEPVLRECLAWRERQQPNEWSTFSAKAMLGAALLGQKKYTDAEPLLREGYEGMKQREATMPPLAKDQLSRTVDRLVDLYQATQDMHSYNSWRSKQSRYSRPRDSAPIQ